MKNRTPSLKTLLREMGPLLDLTEDQLYERQRELVRCELLTERPGRGPGSGVPATHQTVSVFVASILAVDMLRDLKHIAGDEFGRLVQKVHDAIMKGSELSYERSGTIVSYERCSTLRATTITLSAPGNLALQKLLEEKTAIKQPEEKDTKKPVGRPRKYPDSRMSLSIRVTQKVYDVLTERTKESGRSLSEEMEMIFEKAFFPMESAMAERIREPSHAAKQELIHQAYPTRAAASS